MSKVLEYIFATLGYIVFVITMIAIGYGISCLFIHFMNLFFNMDKDTVDIFIKYLGIFLGIVFVVIITLVV